LFLLTIRLSMEFKGSVAGRLGLSMKCENVGACVFFWT
jgi:hypothetical protein